MELCGNISNTYLCAQNQLKNRATDVWHNQASATVFLKALVAAPNTSFPFLTLHRKLHPMMSATDYPFGRVFCKSKPGSLG